MNSMETFLKALSAAEAAPKIVTDESARAAYIAENRSRLPVSKPAAVIYPTCTEQVQKLAELANEYEVTLVVRSSGGVESMRGSSLPAAGTDCVAVNLSGMNRIMNIDPKNNMAIIEAGVTYGQLNEALVPYGLYCEHPLAPRVEKSVIASMLDREPVMTAKHLWDVPDPLCCMEMVMGNGTLFRSGSAAGPGTLEEMLESGCGINQAQGPVWLDLGRVITGSQGTLAMVTWASLKVRPIGSMSMMTYVQSDDIDRLTAYVSMVVRQRLGEEAVILNRKGMAQVFGLDAAAVAGMPKWTYISSARGFRFFPERYMNNQLADMEDIAREYSLTVQRELPGVCNGQVEAVLRGSSPKDDYWKQRYGKDVFELFCLSTMDKIASFTAYAETAAEKCGLEREALCVYAQPTQMARCCHIEFLINADAKTADRLEELLGTVLLDNKAFFSRPYGRLTESVYEKYSDQKGFMPAIKLFFDEKGVMNPGRLVYDSERSVV